MKALNQTQKAYRAMERDTLSDDPDVVVRAERAMSALINRDPGYMKELRFYATREDEFVSLSGEI